METARDFFPGTSLPLEFRNMKTSIGHQIATASHANNVERLKRADQEAKLGIVNVIRSRTVCFVWLITR